MNIEILPYIDQTRVQQTSATFSSVSVSNVNRTTAAVSDVTSDVNPAASFDEIFSDAKKAIAALAVDVAILQAKQSGLDAFSIYSQMANMLGMDVAGLNLTMPTTMSDSTSGANSADVSASSTFQTANILDEVSSGTDYSSLSAHAADYTGDLACSDELNCYFDEAAATYGVDVKLLKAIGKTESNFIPDAQSKAGAMGVMQLMPYTADEMGVADAFDARSNILGGAKLLSQLLKKYNGDISLAAAAYNAGSGAVDKYGGIPPYTETQNYVNKVLNFYENN